MAKNSSVDLLKDPVLLAQKMYREQTEGFTDQYVPPPRKPSLKEWAKQRGYNYEVLSMVKDV
jgi:hypothetical protein